MGERKPSNTYISPEFDPNRPSRRCKPQNGQHQVRFMLPMSIKCINCGEYMFLGTKCNTRKELCYDETYLGLNVYRIYLHCKMCYSEITIKTDPKNCDYIVEKGAERHFEPWRDFLVNQALEEKKKLLGSTMQQVEEKTIDMKKELDNLNELERIRATNTRQLNIDPNLIKPEINNNLILTKFDEEKIKNFKKKQNNFFNNINLNIKSDITLNWKKKSKSLLNDSDSD